MLTRTYSVRHQVAVPGWQATEWETWHWVGSLPREGVVGTHGDCEGASKCDGLRFDGPQESYSIGCMRQCDPRDFIMSNNLGLE